MTYLTYRKRSRDEDPCDFMPISKRINNLSISNPGFGEHETFNAHNGLNASNYSMAINNYDNQSNHSRHTIQSHSNHLHSATHALHANHSTQSAKPATQMPAQDNMHLNGAAHGSGQMECYDPELSVNENPHYYNKNKLLYDLHIERQRRTQSTDRMFWACIYKSKRFFFFTIVGLIHSKIEQIALSFINYGNCVWCLCFLYFWYKMCPFSFYYNQSSDFHLFSTESFISYTLQYLSTVP